MQNTGQMNPPPQGPAGARGQAPGGRGAPPGGRGRGRGRAPRPEPPPELQAERIMALPEAGLIKILQDSGSSEFEKAKACQRLAVIGTAAAVPALASLLGDEHLAAYGRFGLEPNPAPAADAALRQAMGKLNGMLLVGVINSIGHRRDSGSVDVLTKVLYGSDVEAAKAAAGALGRIGGAQSANVLQDALGKTNGDVRLAVAESGLVAADDMIAQGQRDQGLALLDVLSRPEIPKEPRMAAMHLIISAENTLSRPR